VGGRVGAGDGGQDGGSDDVREVAVTANGPRNKGVGRGEKSNLTITKCIVSSFSQRAYMGHATLLLPCTFIGYATSPMNMWLIFISDVA
jgi:hypothetical protein